MKLALPALAFFAGSIVSRALLAATPARFALDLTQPVPVVTWWGATGALFLAVLFAAIVAAFVGYILTLRDESSSLRAVVLAAAAALLAGLLWSPLFSSDTYAYAAYGELVRIGANPYVHLTAASPDAVVAAAQWQWSGSLPACVYGPLFVAIAAAVAWLTHGFGATAQIESFRVLSCAAFLLCVSMLARAGGDDARARRAAIFFGLNPAALWSAIEGHNDTLMLACALCGIVLYRRHAVAGALVAGLGGLIKLPATVTGVALAFSGRPLRARTLIAGAAAIAVVALASLPLAYGMTPGHAPHGRYAPFASVQALHWTLALALAAVVLLRVRIARTPVDRWLLLALAAWLAIPNPYPWYGLWLLPLAAWATDRDAAMTAVLVSAAALLRYIPDAVAIPNAPVSLLQGAAALAAYVPLLRRAIIGRS